MKKQRGISIVEIMIAVTISLILLAGIGQIYLSNKQTYRMTDAVSRLQESGRFAMNFITQSVRSAGHWGCTGSFDNISTELGQVLIPDADGDDDGTDDIHAFNGSVPDVTQYSVEVSALNNVNASVNGVNGLVASDTLRLISASQEGMSVAGAIDAAGTSFDVDNVDSLSTDAPYNNILINDCEKGQVVSMTNIASNAASNNGTITISSSLKQPYSADATIHQLSALTYYLDINAAGNPALFVYDGEDRRELIEGVENFQVCVGSDTDGDLVADYYVAPGTAGLDMNHAVSLKITLSVRSLDDNIALQSRTHASVNNCAAASDAEPNNYTDRRIAKTYTSTIALRNRLN